MNRNPFIVFGPSKSGTTWLQKLLDAHPDVRCHFQLPIFPFSKEESNRFFINKKVIFNKGKSPFKGVFDSDSQEKKYRSLEQMMKSNDLLKTKNIQKINTEAEIENIRIMVMNFLNDDGNISKKYGTKAYTNIDNLIKIFPLAKMVAIVRDGRDVIVSKRFHSMRMGVYYIGDEKNKYIKYIANYDFLFKGFKKLDSFLHFFSEDMFAIDEKKVLNQHIVTVFSKEWVNVTEYIYEMEKKYSDNIMIVKYEDLRVDSYGVYVKILDFLCVNWNQEQVEGIIQSYDVKKIQKDSNTFVRKGEVGDWKNYFDITLHQTFIEIAGNTLSKCGYNREFI